MKILTVFTAAAALSTGISHAQQPGESIDSQSTPFSFEDAWNQPRGLGSAMAMIPDFECEAASVGGVCDEYVIGVAIEGGGEMTPVFNAYGHLERTSIWHLPESSSHYRIDLGSVMEEAGVTRYSGEMRVGCSMIAGWLTTPNGYSEFVTGYLWSIVMEIESPEPVDVGSMIFEPTRTWSDPDVGVSYISILADAVWHDSIPATVNDFDQGPGKASAKKIIKCRSQYRIDSELCTDYHRADIRQAVANHADCVDGIGIFDCIVDAVVGGTGGALAGIKIGSAVGAGCGTAAAPGVGTAAGGIFGGTLGLCAGAVGGAWYGMSSSQDACDQELSRSRNKANAQFQKCIADARAKERRCLLNNR